MTIFTSCDNILCNPLPSLPSPPPLPPTQSLQDGRIFFEDGAYRALTYEPWGREKRTWWVEFAAVVTKAEKNPDTKKCLW